MIYLFLLARLLGVLILRRAFTNSSRYERAHRHSRGMNIVRVGADHVRANSHLYNSGPHPPDTLLTSIPALGLQRAPSTSTTYFCHWLPLILKSQAIDRRRPRIVDLSPAYARLLIDAGDSGRIVGRIPHTHREDLLELGTFDHLFDAAPVPQYGYFMRLNACSPKDGVNSRRPLLTSADIVERIVTSQRATHALMDSFTNWFPIRLYFLPFDPTMDPMHEYRCFSAPVSAVCKEPKLTAISQYRWTQKCPADRSTEAFLKDLLTRVRCLHHNILTYSRRLSPAIQKAVREEGFVFDVRCTKQGSVQLIELNEFGIASRCGSALFHWVNDARLLYGGQENVEIRLVD
jgi:hypothetical protein